MSNMRMNILSSFWESVTVPTERVDDTNMRETILKLKSDTVNQLELHGKTATADKVKLFH